MKTGNGKWKIANLSVEDFATHLANMSELQQMPGQRVFFHVGERIKRFYVVLEGSMDVYSQKPPKEIQETIKAITPHIPKDLKDKMDQFAMWETWLQTRPDQNKFFEFRRSFQNILQLVQKKKMDSVLFPEKLGFLFLGTHKFFHYFKNGIFTYKHIMSIQPGGNIGSLQFDDGYSRCTSIFTETQVTLCCIKRSRYKKFLEILSSAPLSLVHSPVTLIQEKKDPNKPVSPKKLKKSSSFRGMKRAVSIIKREKTRTVFEKPGVHNFLQPPQPRRSILMLDPIQTNSSREQTQIGDTSLISADTASIPNRTHSAHEPVQPARLASQRPKISARVRPFNFPQNLQEAAISKKEAQRAIEEKEWLEKLKSLRSSQKGFDKKSLQRSFKEIPELKSFMEDEVIARNFGLKHIVSSTKITRPLSDQPFSIGETLQSSRKNKLPVQEKLKVLVNQEPKDAHDYSERTQNITLNEMEGRTNENVSRGFGGTSFNIREKTAKDENKSMGEMKESHGPGTFEELAKVGRVEKTDGPFLMKETERKGSWKCHDLSAKNKKSKGELMVWESRVTRNRDAWQNSISDENLKTPFFGHKVILDHEPKNNEKNNEENLFLKRKTYKELVNQEKRGKEKEINELKKHLGSRNSESGYLMRGSDLHQNDCQTLWRKEKDLRVSLAFERPFTGALASLTRPLTSSLNRNDFFGLRKQREESPKRNPRFHIKKKETGASKRPAELKNSPKEPRRTASARPKRAQSRLIPFSKSRLVGLKQSMCLLESPGRGSDSELDGLKMNQYYEPPEDYIPNNSYHKYKKMVLKREEI